MFIEGSQARRRYRKAVGVLFGNCFKASVVNTEVPCAVIVTRRNNRGGPRTGGGLSGGLGLNFRRRTIWMFVHGPTRTSVDPMSDGRRLSEGSIASQMSQ